MLRPIAVLALMTLAACGNTDLTDPPVPLGEFALGINVAVADNVEMVPISRPATEEELETSMKDAVAARFGRYEGSKLYNIGISIDAYALAPPGIPVVAAPKSIMVVTANIWDDGAAKKLNPEGKQFTVFESLSGETVIGTGLTRSKKQQMDALSFNAVKKVETWLLEHPEWFDMTKEQMEAALAARDASIKAAPKSTAKSKVEPEAEVESEPSDTPPPK